MRVVPPMPTIWGREPPPSSAWSYPCMGGVVTVSSMRFSYSAAAADPADP